MNASRTNVNKQTISMIYLCNLEKPDEHFVKWAEENPCDQLLLTCCIITCHHVIIQTPIHCSGGKKEEVNAMSLSAKRARHLPRAAVLHAGAAGVQPATWEPWQRGGLATITET